MTRPTHLLCLAMSRSLLDKDKSARKKLEERGWTIKTLGS